MLDKTALMWYNKYRIKKGQIHMKKFKQKILLKTIRKYGFEHRITVLVANILY